MKLELLDAYNIRARLSASIILLSPIAITVFLCFDEINNLASSTVFIGMFLAFTNYIPILLRRIYGYRQFPVNYAVEYLMPDDHTIDPISKHRYYATLAKMDASFEPLLHPDNCENFRNCCISAIIYLKEHTRENRLVQEENINYGFCRNLFHCKIIGIIINMIMCILIGVCALIKYDFLSTIPVSYYMAFVTNFAMIFFWSLGITKKTLENAAKVYSQTLLASINSIN